MRFNHLNMKAFGHFSDYELQFDPLKNFHLIYGPNEAGKSTTLRSITHFLYGFPTQTKDSFLHGHTKLRIEGELQNTKGQTIQFARRKGTKNTVLDSNDQPLNEEIVSHFLNGISEKHFLNMFALNHDSLRQGGESLLQSGGNVGESLFSAASGINLLGKVLEELEKKSGDFYKKSARNPKLNKLLIKEKELQKEIMELHLKIQTWKDLENKYNEGQKEIEDIIKLVKSLRSEEEKLQRIKLTLPKIARLKDFSSKLAALGDVPSLQENAEQRRKEAEQKLESANKDKKKAEDEISILKLELDKLDVPDVLIEQELLIDSLYREVQSYQNHLTNIPILEGERKQLEDRVVTFLKEMDSVNTILESIDLYRLSASKKETIKELCKQSPLLNHAAESIRKERLLIVEELEKKEAQLAEMEEFPDIDDLENIINTVKSAGPIEDTLLSLLKETEHKELQIKEEIRLLPLWDGSYQEFVNLQVPSLMETLKKFEQDRLSLLQKLQKVQEQVNLQIAAIESNKKRIRELEALSEIPSEDKLIQVRTHRDIGWKLIRTKLGGGNVDIEHEISNVQPLETVFEDSMKEADNIADKMRLEAAKVGEKNKLLSDIESSKNKIEELAFDKNRLEDHLDKWEKAWLELWQPSNLKPLTPEEMKEWLIKFNQIKTMVQELDKTKSSILELEKRKVQYKQELTLVLLQFGNVGKEYTLAEMLARAEKQQKIIRESFFLRQSLVESIFEIKRKLHINEEKQREIESSVSKWRDSWIQAIQGTTITDKTPVNVAESLIHQYETGVKAFDELKRKEKEQESLQAQISHFEEKVKNVVSMIPIHLEEQNIAIVVNRLNAALQQAKQDKVKINNIQNQLTKLQLIIKQALTVSEEAKATLDELIKHAQCTCIEELEKVERIFAFKQDLEVNIALTEEELLQLGNGRTLQELVGEADHINPDSLKVELEEIQRELEEIEPRRSKLEQEHGVVKKEFEEKIQGSNTASVLAEQKKESMLAEMAALTDQYVQLKLAATLLQKGIEHYRSQNQDPIIKRASELFERLTLQSFTGLTVDYDEKDQPVLMGVRENGDKVSIDGMSDGTTDQLYLALRVASIEKYAHENEPVPFIVDDILVHFDDTRSKETLRILLELSKKTQIIFFTHHYRLVEIIREISIEMEYQLVELNKKQPVMI
jgi:uncharacterized protein YhaN